MSRDTKTASLAQTTQTVGDTTGLGSPLNGLLSTVGNGLDSAGSQVSGATGNPLAPFFYRRDHQC
jgi:hypothetical protein